jgi:hypothetical protein
MIVGVPDTVATVNVPLTFEPADLQTLATPCAGVEFVESPTALLALGGAMPSTVGLDGLGRLHCTVNIALAQSRATMPDRHKQNLIGSSASLEFIARLR